MDSLEARLQTLSPATRTALLDLIETLLANQPAGPKLAPPPTRGRPRPTPAALVAAQEHMSPRGSAVDTMVVTALCPIWDASQEAAVLEVLRERYPLVASARQWTAQLSLPHIQVRTILLALARGGVVESPNEGSYRCGPEAACRPATPEGGAHG